MPLPLITAVIPVRLSNEQLYDEVERIERIIETLPDAYVPLVVDYGTGPGRADELKALAEKTKTALLCVETEDQPFSIGHARDLGTQHAQTPLVMFHDIDFLISPGNYNRILDEVRLRSMPENAYSFFALPGTYLTKEFTEKYLTLFSAGDAEFADVLLHDGVMRADNSICDNHTYAISAIVASRYHLLAIGGHDRSFAGHGAEDFELMHRLSSYALKAPRTHQYYTNTRKNSIQRYEGFRAYFALYGIDLFQRGLQVAHLWHPRRREASYVAPMAENQQRVSQLMEDYDAGKSSLPSLEDSVSGISTLVLVKDEKAPPIRALRHAFPAFGRYEIKREGDFEDGLELVKFAQEKNFSRVFFLNPYGNEHRLALYRAVRHSGMKFVVWDRGGLSDSWFFDTGGFLADSTSYSPEKWDQPLAEKEIERTKQWLQTHRDSPPLEKNGERIGAEALSRQLKIGDRKVIFVALQRPNDTATRYFSDSCGGFDGFRLWMEHLARNLDPQTCVIVAKQHPLEQTSPEIAGVQIVDGKTNFIDLIDLADVVVTINSGAGLVALSCGKPVICCGDSYYSHPGLAVSVRTEAELVDAVRNATPPDEEKKLRFFRYLIEDFYSFGKSIYKTSVKEGSEIRRVTAILFSSIRGLREKTIILGEVPDQLNLKAPLFYSYGGEKHVQSLTSPIDLLVKQTEKAVRKTEIVEATRLLEALHLRQNRKEEFSSAVLKTAQIARRNGNNFFAAMILGLGAFWKTGDNDSASHEGRRDDCAEKLMQSVAQLALSPISELRALAVEAFVQENYVEAIRLFEAMYLREPDKIKHLRCLAECYVKIGAETSALKTLRLVLNAAPGHKMVERRLKNIQRPRILRPLYPGKPFPVELG
ncbi:capsular biosynthesis protein [Labrenzia sp. CE80]|uniref:capsular polysaccharide export protein, LipB/KpsS family n=1 Tax=Labrenzia sp. CE80 TaxID=1788986 RepID=UPI0013897A47|nr:capsular biosynthesis protein [Labrenzia sp. CE80]